MAYSQEVADDVCARLAAGESLRKAAKANNVDPSTILRWVSANEAFAQQYARAREIGYRLLADELLEISDDSSRDIEETEHGPQPNKEMVARARLRVDTRKWLLSKMLPKVYGERLEVNGNMTVRTLVDELASLNGAVSSSNGGSEVA